MPSKNLGADPGESQPTGSAHAAFRSPDPVPPPPAGSQAPPIDEEGLTRLARRQWNSQEERMYFFGLITAHEGWSAAYTRIVAREAGLW